VGSLQKSVDMQERVGLTKEQLIELTGYSRSSKQCEALAFMGIKYWLRMDGTPFVPHSTFNPIGTEKPSALEAKLKLI